jgi:hypothetical protein
MKPKPKQGDIGNHDKPDIRIPNLSPAMNMLPRLTKTTIHDTSQSPLPKLEFAQRAAHHASTLATMEAKENAGCPDLLGRSLSSVHSPRRTPTLGAHRAATRTALPLPR